MLSARSAHLCSNLSHLSLLSLPLSLPLSLSPYLLPPSSLSPLSLSMVFFTCICRKAQAAVNTNDLATYFLEQFNKNVFCVGQQVGLGRRRGRGHLAEGEGWGGRICLAPLTSSREVKEGCGFPKYSVIGTFFAKYFSPFICD